MSIGEFPADIGQYFRSAVVQTFKSALEILHADDAPEEERLNRLNQVRRTFECWRYDHTITPRPGLSGVDQGLVKEYADPVYRALDEAHAAVVRKTGLKYANRESFCVACYTSAQSYLYDLAARRKTAEFVSAMAELGRKVTITLDEPSYPMKIEVLMQFLAEAITRLEKPGCDRHSRE